MYQFTRILQRKPLLFLFLNVYFFQLSFSEPVTLFLGGTTAAFFAGYLIERYEIGAQWINLQPEFSLLRQSLIGQPIAFEIVSEHVRKHLSNPTPSRALVLSFHGSTGIGKTFTAEHIAKALFEKYRKFGTSKYVYAYKGAADQSKSPEEKAQGFIRFVEKGIAQSERSLFIIEEIDKLPSKFMDHLLPYVREPSVKINGTPYPTQKLIFILLSNTGGNVINSLVYERSKKDGRGSLRYGNFEPLIPQLTNEGGLKDSSLVKGGFISHYVPFLPLERQHVKQCLIDLLKEQKGKPLPEFDPGTSVLENILDQIEFMKQYGEQFSRYGCRRVKSVVAMFL